MSVALFGRGQEALSRGRAESPVGVDAGLSSEVSYKAAVAPIGLPLGEIRGAAGIA